MNLNPESTKPENPLQKKAEFALTCVLSFVVIVLISLTASRVYKNYQPPATEFNWILRGHSDFHNGTYFPSLAFRDRINPYAVSVKDKFPVASAQRPCPPITFISHIPFTFLSLKNADVAFFAYNTLLLLGLAYFAVHVTRGSFHLLSWLAVCCVLLISRPGHITLFTGYYTLELVFGTLLALHFAKRKPWLAAIGMLIASGKPTFILPLIILMIARKNYQAAVSGIVLCTIFGIGGLGWLAAESSFSEVISSVFAGQAEFHADESELPINTWTRVDLMGMFAKAINWVPDDKAYLLGMIGLMIVPCILINQIVDREENTGASGLTSTIALLTMLLAIYHHSYDCLLIAVPWVGFAFFRQNIIPESSHRTKLVLAALLTVPLLNYLATQSARDKLGLDQLSFIWQSITMINGACLLIALTILMTLAFHLAVGYTIRRDFGK